MNKNLLYLLIFLVVLISAGIYDFLVWQEKMKQSIINNQEESNSQMLTYKHNQYGYEFNYPEGIKIIKNEITSSVTIYDSDLEDATIEIMAVSKDWFYENYRKWEPEVDVSVNNYSSGSKEITVLKNFNSELYGLLIASSSEGSDIILARQTKQTDLLNKIFDTIVFKKEDLISGLKKEFSYPYPVSWIEDDISFSLKEIYLGKTFIPERVSNNMGGFYEENEEVNALTLILEITNYNIESKCVDLNIGRIINEEGDIIVPNIFSPSSDCVLSGGASKMQKVIFVVPETDKIFNMTTVGLKKNIFFTITRLDADGIVTEKPLLQLDKNITEEGLRKVYPYNADTFVCMDAAGNSYKTTGQASEFQSWFIYGSCPTSKDYRVVPGKEIILDIRTDILSCHNCVCNNPSFSLYEYRDRESKFLKIKEFNYKNVSGVSEKIYYTPISDRVRIVSEGCFYLDFFQEGQDNSRIILNSLNEGETLHFGDIYRIEWDSANLNGNINIELVNKEDIEGSAGAKSWQISFNKVPINIGVYEWKIGDLSKEDQNALYKIHIFSNNNVFIEDYSDNYFSISK